MLEIRGVGKTYSRRKLADRLTGTEADTTVALDDVSLTVQTGQTMGIVGESGSGKTTLARVIVRLVKPDHGVVKLNGENILALRGRELSQARRRVQLVYQDPYSSLNPAMTVAAAIGEPAVVHGLVDKSAARARVAELMERVGLNAALARRRPRELSGGQRQRVAIARALAAQPDVLITDEATSALDVSVQAQVLALLGELQRDLELTLVFISHQLATVAQLCENVAIMYRGRIVELGPTWEVFQTPRHGYTIALLRAHPGHGRIGTAISEGRGAHVVTTPAVDGCAFEPRCAFAKPKCKMSVPDEVVVSNDHTAQCSVLPEMDPSEIRTQMHALGVDV